MTAPSMVAAKTWCKDHPDEPVVEFMNVSFASEGHVVLDSISFKVRGGETRILLGRSGSGKSVLLKMANGLMKPDSGAVRVFGKDLTTMPEEDLFAFRQDIGMVFQDGALFDSLSVRDNVAYQLIESHVSSQDVDKRAAEVLSFVGLEEAIDKFPPELSGGMQRRVAVARAIIGEPELILYDSPTAGLDPVTSETIIELVIKQRDARGSSSVVVTQRLQDAFTCATHHFDQVSGKLIKLPDGQEDKNTTFLMLNDGKIVFDGPTLDFVHSKDPFIRSFLE